MRHKSNDRLEMKNRLLWKEEDKHIYLDESQKEAQTR